MAILIQPRESGREGVVDARRVAGIDGFRVDDVGRDAGRQAHVREPDRCARAGGVVPPQVFGVHLRPHPPPRAPMGEKEIQIAIEIVVAERRRHGVAGADGVQAGAGGDVRESAVAVVAEQKRRIELQAADEEVQVAVAVNVRERRAGVAVVLRGRFGVGHPGGRGHFGKDVAAQVAVEQVGADVAPHHEEVHPAVVVVVPRGHAAAEGFRIGAGGALVAVPIMNPGCRGDIREPQGHRRRRRRRGRFGRRRGRHRRRTATATTSATARKAHAESRKDDAGRAPRPLRLRVGHDGGLSRAWRLRAVGRSVCRARSAHLHPPRKSAARRCQGPSAASSRT